MNVAPQPVKPQCPKLMRKTTKQYQNSPAGGKNEQKHVKRFKVLYIYLEFIYKLNFLKKALSCKRLTDPDRDVLQTGESSCFIWRPNLTKPTQTHECNLTKRRAREFALKIISNNSKEQEIQTLPVCDSLPGRGRRRKQGRANTQIKGGNSEAAPL